MLRLEAPEPRFDPDLARAEVATFTDALVACAIRGARQATWMTRRLFFAGSMRAADRPTLERVDATIHAGQAGILLHLLAARRSIGTSRWDETLEAALAHLDARKERGDSRQRHSYGAGELGTIWVAHLAADALGSAEALRMRDRWIESLWRRRHAPASVDLNTGDAGGIATLLRLADEGAPRAEALARHLADRVVAAATRDGGGRAWWTSVEAPPGKGVTGLSHGAAGIGWALAHAARRFGEPRYHELAEEAFAYERAHFDENRGDWRDVRRVRGPEGGFAPYWCYGAPGQGLARLAAVDALGPHHAGDLAIAADRTAESLPLVDQAGANACLCHGVAGNVDALWVLDEKLGRTRGPENARASAARLIARHPVASPFGWPVDSPGDVPSLMTGRSGVALFLLRVADGGRTPTALLPPAP